MSVNNPLPNYTHMNNHDNNNHNHQDEHISSSSSLSSTTTTAVIAQKVISSDTPLISNRVGAGAGFNIPIDDEDDDCKGTASASSGIVNLANTILGTGMLAQSAAIASLGLIFGSLMIAFAGFTSSLGLYFLSRCATKAEPRKSSFNAIALLTYPKAAILFDLAIAIKCFGVSISYLIIIGDLMPQVVQVFSSDTVHGIPDILINRRFWITVFFLAIVPLSFLRKLDSLRYTSMVALVAVVYLLVIVVWFFCDPNTPSPPPDSVKLVHISTKFFTNLPVFIFAFTCHQNIFSIVNELKDQSQGHVNKVIGTSIGTSLIIYEFIGILGYLTFGENVESNIITMYPHTFFVNLGRLAIVILVLFSYPLQFHPCRACLEKVLCVCFPTEMSHQALPTEEDSEDGDSTSNHHTPLKSSLPAHASSNFTFIILTIAILISSYTISMLVSKLDLVLSFVGASGSTTISFILPGLFYARMFRDEAKFQQGIAAQWERIRVLAAMALMVYGVTVFIVSNYFNILHLIQG